MLEPDSSEGSKKRRKTVDCPPRHPRWRAFFLQLRSFLHQTPSTVPLDVRADRETSTPLSKQGESEAFHAHGSQTTVSVCFFYILLLTAYLE